jgi:serpin B
MKQIILLFSLVFGFLLFSCESKNIEEPKIPEIEETEDDDDPQEPKYISDPIKINLTSNELSMTKDNTNFAMKFFSTINESSQNEENIVVSPFSMSMALAVLRNGAEGETKQAIEETMGMKDFPETEINAYFRKLKDALIATDPTLSLAVANSIWYDKSAFTIKKDFEDLSKTWYDAPITGLDYGNMAVAVATVNKWCEDNTNGLIKDMVKDLTDVEILNALYFKGDWSYGHEFDVKKTTKQSFTKSNSVKIEVDMMHKEYDKDILLGFYKDNYLSIVSLPYGNEAYSIYFVLPAENGTFDEMIKQLPVSGYWLRCINRCQPSIVDVYIPKFEVKYEKDLRDILVELGMGVACSGNAQFPHIAENQNFFVDRSKQKTYIKVNEEGAEAAAITEIGMTTIDGEWETGGPAVFRADRPFLFVIQENSTGTVLFMGKIGNPVK